MSSEPEWTKRFSNDNVCNFYYYMSVAVVLFGFMNLFFVVFALMSTSGKYRIMLTAQLVGTLIQLTLSYFVYLFLYLMCTRSINK